MKCIQCGSTDLVQNARVIDRGEDNRKWDLEIETNKNPRALIFKEAIKAAVHAKVCGACGYVMLFADVDDVQDLKQGI